MLTPPAWAASALALLSFPSGAALGLRKKAQKPNLPDPEGRWRSIDGNLAGRPVGKTHLVAALTGASASKSRGREGRDRCRNGVNPRKARTAFPSRRRGFFFTFLFFFYLRIEGWLLGRTHAIALEDKPQNGAKGSTAFPVPVLELRKKPGTSKRDSARGFTSRWGFGRVGCRRAVRVDKVRMMAPATGENGGKAPPLPKTAPSIWTFSSRQGFAQMITYLPPTDPFPTPRIQYGWVDLHTHNMRPHTPVQFLSNSPRNPGRARITNAVRASVPETPTLPS